MGTHIHCPWKPNTLRVVLRNVTAFAASGKKGEFPLCSQRQLSKARLGRELRGLGLLPTITPSFCPFPAKEGLLGAGHLSGQEQVRGLGTGSCRLVRWIKDSIKKVIKQNNQVDYLDVASSSYFCEET